MLMNAQPRIVSNGIEAVVPAQRLESLHRRLVEMTNNDVNAWSIFRSAATSTTNSWNQHINDFGVNENFPPHTLYSGYFQDPSAGTQAPAVNMSKISSYSSGHQAQSELEKKPPVSQAFHRGMEFDSFDMSSPMLGTNHSQWDLGFGRGCIAEFANARNEFKDFQYQSLNESDLAPFTSALSLAPSPYSGDPSLAGDYLNINRTSPGTAYSNYSSPVPANPEILLYANVPGANETLTKSSWWPEDIRNSMVQYHDTIGFPFGHDGLPKNQDLQRQYCDVWNIRRGLANSWSLDSAAPDTISPKLLTLNISSAPLSSSGSSQGTSISTSESNAIPSIANEREDFEPLAVVVPPKPAQTRRPRQLLPDSQPSSRRLAQGLSHNDIAASKTTKKGSLKSERGSHTRAATGPVSINTASAPQGTSKKAESSSQRSSAPKKIEPKPETDIAQASWTNSPQSAATILAMHKRNSKDDFLVRSKLAGMSYKDIRRHGKFTEAESTLRGRFRTLTKHKAARVRKPEWDDNDIRLLKKAVRKLSNESDSSKSRVPWKQVAEYIANNGGSYHFGNATCRKRWDELHGRSGS